MKIVDFSIRRPVTITILVAVVLILSFFTFSKLPVDLLPEMKFPISVVITSYPGAGPEEVESHVTKPLEGAVNSISNIQELQSISSEGTSIILISFKWGTDMDSTSLDIREKIGLVETYLPDSCEKPMVIKMDPTMMPVIQMGIGGGDDLAQMQAIAEDIIEPRLSRIPEIASVVIAGGLEREVTVEVDPVKLENYGLSLSQLTQMLQMENFNMSGGQIEQGDRKFFVRNLQQFESLEDIRNVAILTSSGQTIYLGEIATVEDSYKDATQYTMIDGGPAVGIYCLKQSDANTVKACDAVKKELKKIEDELDMDLNVKIVFDQSIYVKQSINSTGIMILEGALLAMLVLFVFLRNARSTLIIFTSIPLSIVATFILMYFTNYTMNLVTMGGLALGVGRIVDDSIVVFENIYRHRMLGLPRVEAAQKGAAQVGQAVIAATLTIMAVFLPIVFVKGLASIIFKPLAMTICFSIFCSLLVALTIIPLLSSRVLTDEAMKPKEGGGKVYKAFEKMGLWLDNLGERYKVLLEKALQRRRLVVLAVTVMMIASLAVTPLIGAEFLPMMDSGEISINIEADKGSSLQSTGEIAEQVEEKLRELPELETIFTSTGNSSAMMMSSSASTGTDSANIYVKLRPKGERKRSVIAVAEQIRQDVSSIAGAKINVSVMDVTSGLGGLTPVNVQVRGDDLEVLKELSEQIAQIVRNVPGTREVVSSLTDGKPEMQVKIDRKRAAAYGLTPIQISNEVSTAMQGKVATRYKVEGDEINVRVRYKAADTKDIDYLSSLSIMTPMGSYVKLGQLATFEIAQGPISITRVDQVRKAEISADLANRDLNSVITDIQRQAADLKLPAGYEIEYGGENKEMMETFGDLALALLLAIILVYAVMAIQYESFFAPFVIMFSVPTALIGVVFGLLLTGRTFSVPAFIGLILLVGVVVSNAIVFVDYLQQMIAAGMERNAAIVETGRVRLRPILMTAFSTILAMLPLSLGLKEGGEYQAPMATVVIGGLLVSTLVTLVLVPVVYTIFDDWGRKLSSMRKSKKDVAPKLDIN